MKKRLFNLAMALMIVLIFFGENVQSAFASTPESIDHALITGSVQCGSLKGWGVWRSTENIAMINRTVFFEPSRVGTHKIQFYAVGAWADGVMTPYWSNDGGKKWVSWKWSPGYYKDNTVTLDLRTDTTSTIYKFVFYSGTSTKKVVWYRFYCK
jgi:hypothetical protein